MPHGHHEHHGDTPVTSPPSHDRGPGRPTGHLPGRPLLAQSPDHALQQGPERTLELGFRVVLEELVATSFGAGLRAERDGLQQEVTQEEALGGVCAGVSPVRVWRLRMWRPRLRLTMITAQGVNCVVTLEREALTVIRFLGGGHSMRVMPATGVDGVHVTAPGRWRHGTLRLDIAANVGGARVESIEFARPQLPNFFELAQHLERAGPGFPEPGPAVVGRV